MGVQLHSLANDIGDLMVAAVIHIVQSLQEAALDRLQPVFDGGDRPLFYDIGSIFEEIGIEKFV